MSYLLPSSTVDDLLLMLAVEDGRTRPDAWTPDELAHLDEHARRWMEQSRPRVQAPGSVWLNATDNALAAYGPLVYQSSTQYRVMHLTWAGWDRVDELIAEGRGLPSADELAAYARDGDTYAMSGVDPREPVPAPPRRWWHRFRRTSTPPEES